MAKKVMLKVAPPAGDPIKGGIGSSKESRPNSITMPGVPGIPLYIPHDTEGGPIHLEDKRTINPATGGAFSRDRMGAKSLSVHPGIIKAIVAHAKAKGIDPYDALSIPYQESGFGKSGTGLGENKDYFPDKGVEDSFDDLDERNMNLEVNAMMNALSDKFKYAKRLGFSNKGKDYQFQAYNGYGKLRPQAGEKTTSFYGLPVSHEAPLDMAKNPVYGKVVSSLRNILVNNPRVKQIVETTPAFRNVWDQTPSQEEQQQPAPKVMLNVRK